MSEVENKLKKWIPAFNVERQIKSIVANTMLTDATDFYLRIRILLKHIEYVSFSYKSKIYIDLLMAIESDLKSLILILSNKEETPEQAYLVARKCGHSISKLYQEVESRAYRRIKLLKLKEKDCLLNRAVNIKVDNRYQLITLTKLREDGKMAIDTGIGKYSSLLTLEYIETLLAIGFKLHQIARKGEDKYLDKMSKKGTNIKKFDKRFKEFSSVL